MAQEPINPITEDDKRRLTRYLIDRVLEGISGRLPNARSTKRREGRLVVRLRQAPPSG